jgi:hypothetical protein
MTFLADVDGQDISRELTNRRGDSIAMGSMGVMSEARGVGGSLD